MTTLDKPLSRLIEFGGREIIVTVVPADAGFPPHVKLREKGHKKSYASWTIDPPATVKP